MWRYYVTIIDIFLVFIFYACKTIFYDPDTIIMNIIFKRFLRCIFLSKRILYLLVQSIDNLYLILSCKLLTQQPTQPFKNNIKCKRLVASHYLILSSRQLGKLDKLLPFLWFSSLYLLLNIAQFKNVSKAHSK